MIFDIKKDEKRAVIEVTCPICGKHQIIVVNKKTFEDWVAGKKLLQDAFPDLTPDEREALMTGICTACWSSFEKEDEDEEA